MLFHGNEIKNSVTIS